MKILITLISSALLILCSCSKKLISEKPSLVESDFNLDSLPVSEINIPIAVNLRPIFAEAETSVDTLFTSPNWPNDWIQDDCATRYKYYFRRGPLHLSASANILNIGFTGFYKIIGSTRACAGNTALSPWTPPCQCGFSEGERRVNINFRNAIMITPDYKAKLQIVRQEPQALDKCTVCFWGQDITTEVLKGLKAELDLAKLEIEKSFGITDLKPHFQQVWDKLNTAYNLYGLGWLQVNPQNLRINNLFARNDSLYIFLGLSARPKISLVKPTDYPYRVPNLSEASHRQGFNIFLDADLNYDSLSVLINQHLRDKRLDLDQGPLKKYIIIKDVQLSGMNNENLVFKVDFEGSEKGTMYLTGKPFYDDSTKTIGLKDLDFDVKTRNMLVRTAKWIFNRRIVNELERNSRFPLAAYMDSAIAMANTQLNSEPVKGIHTSGTINEVKLIAIYPLKEHLLIRSNASGQLAVKVESVGFSF